MSARARRLGWRASVASGIPKLRRTRSPRVNGGKGRLETVSGSKGMEVKNSGVEQRQN